MAQSAAQMTPHRETEPKKPSTRRRSPALRGAPKANSSGFTGRGETRGPARLPRRPCSRRLSSSEGRCSPGARPGAIQDSLIEGRGARFLATKTLLEAMKTSLLQPFLIATRNSLPASVLAGETLKNKSPRPSVGRQKEPSLPASFLAGKPLSIVVGETFSAALKTNVLRHFLIATPTRVANSQLSQNQQYPIF
jgi:hypothetical protein